MTKRRGPDTYRRLRRALALRSQLKLTGRAGRDYTRACKRAIANGERFDVKAAALCFKTPPPPAPSRPRHAPSGAYNRLGAIGRLVGHVEAWKLARDRQRGAIA